MIIDLVKLGESQFEFDLQIAPHEMDLESEFLELKKPVSFKGKLDNQIIRVELGGQIFAEVDIDCDRCLTPVRQNLVIEFENALVTPENLTEEQEIELEIKDLDVSIITESKIDLEEIAREQILLALPARIICRDDCKGLCEKCGANRNLINCNCNDKIADPRWSALKNLKIDNKK